MLFDTGLPHVSGNLHQSVWERYAQGDQAVAKGLDELQQAGRAMHGAIVDEQKTAFGEALRSVMNGVELLNPALHAPFRSVLEPLEASGEVIAWKAMGAGGGGVVGVLRNQEAVAAQRIKKAAEAANWTHLEWDIDFDGLQRAEVINHE
jgi:galactokinase/mevalonate kinase-like predicted kinase